MRARKLWLCACLFVFVATGNAQEVSEQEAVRRFLATSPMVRLWQAEVEITRAEWRALGLLPNPTINAVQEDAGGTRDQFLTLQQTLPVTGRVSFLRRAGRSAVSATQGEVGRRRQVAVAEFRKTYVVLAIAQRREVLLRQNAERLRELVRVLREREKAGEGSGFDVLRAERELANAEADWGLAQVAIDQARSRLASLVPDLAGAGIVAGVELPGELPSVEDAIQQAIAHRPDYRAKKSEIEQFESQRLAATRQAIPEPTFYAGLKRTTVAGIPDNGFAAGLTIPLPLFNRGQADVQRYTAEQQRGSAEQLLLERQVQAEVRSAHAAALAGARLASEYQPGPAIEVLRSAETSYQEGERGILELLDAYRLVAASELRRLDLLSAAKEARIDFDLAIGTEVQP